MKKEFLLSIIISLAFLLSGFFLLHYEFIDYGPTYFILLPFILGFIAGKATFKSIGFAGLLTSLVFFFIVLFTGKLEGAVCILMALPLIIASVALGALISYLLTRKKRKADKSDIIKSSLVPFVIFLCIALLEKWLTKNHKAVISVKTEIVLPYTPMEVYDAIKSVDTLIAEKTFLMKLDLPVPRKCILEKEEVGGLRTCYFDGGTITERITELEKAKTLRMDVIDYKLTGRKWLGFKEAIYYFDQTGKDSCKLTRITTYTSVLAPRFYWQPLEKMGISQEHDYVFANLKNDLQKKYRRQN